MSETKLEKAVLSGQKKKVEKLLASGEDIDERTSNYCTPLSLAVRENKTEIVKLLLEKGANMEIMDTNGLSPLGEAVLESNTYNIAKLLIEKGANINIKNRKGLTPLLYVISNSSDVIFAKYLLDKGADINEKDNEGRRAFDLAKNNKMKTFVEESFTESPWSDSGSKTIKERDKQCVICDEPNDKNSFPVCVNKHKFHQICICDWINKSNNYKHTCPTCRAEIKEKIVKKCKSRRGGRKLKSRQTRRTAK